MTLLKSIWGRLPSRRRTMRATSPSKRSPIMKIKALAEIA
jgi:hypothetical protein